MDFAVFGVFLLFCQWTLHDFCSVHSLSLCMAANVWMLVVGGEGVCGAPFDRLHDWLFEGAFALLLVYCLFVLDGGSFCHFVAF